MKIIPAIDIINGQCVRLSQGDYSKKKIYADNPLEMAKQFEANGIQYLHLVDLDGVKAGHIVNWQVLEAICTQTSLQVDFGGGLKSDEDINIAFNCGAKQITGGSIAVKNQALFLDWLQKYGSDKIILGADVKEEQIAVSGWEETTNRNLFEFLAYYISKGISTVICTDIAKDGLLGGVSLDLYKKINDTFPALQLIASGGVAKTEDLDMLNELNVYAVIIGKAIYEKSISLRDLKAYL